MKSNYSQETLDQLEAELVSAIRKKEFKLEYEPIFELKNKEICGVNALVRWDHPKYGMVSPENFIKLAERNDSINSLGAWVLEKACTQFSNWHQKKLVPSSLKLDINISLKQLEQENFLSIIDNVLSKTHVDPSWIEFQLTESQILDKKLISIIKTIREKGIRLVLDNFGIPYSSLTYLSFFEIETIEIDKSFVKAIGTPEGDKLASIYFTVLRKRYDVKILAEGVETESQLNFLRKYKCDYVAGFYFTKPLDADNFEKFLRRNRK